MAITKSAITLQDTPTKYRVMTTGLAGDATELTDSVFADLSALKYATTTVTLADVPTTNFCIGEILTTNDGTPVYMVVQDYTAGAATVDVYRCTSGTDNTPLGWDTASATNVGTGKSLTGSVSGLADELTHGSTRLSINTPTVNLRHLWWDLAAGITYARIYFDGSGTEEDIAYLRGGSSGSWDFASWGSSITMGAAAGNSANVLGDINVTTVGVGAADTYLIGLEIQKASGFNTPNYEGNGQLGYSTQKIQGQNY
jgi:hypothetical protein